MVNTPPSFNDSMVQMNIRETREKIKRWRAGWDSRDAYVLLLFIFVGFGSFGLGRLSKLQESRMPLRIQGAGLEQTAAAAPHFLSPRSAATAESAEASAALPEKEEKETVAPGGQFVASRAGGKYHFPWCPGAQRISEANKIWFSSVEEARKAGYTPASNCKGLK